MLVAAAAAGSLSDPDRQICYLAQVLCVCTRVPLKLIEKLSCDICITSDYVACVVDMSPVRLTGIGCKSERAVEVPKATLFDYFWCLILSLVSVSRKNLSTLP